MTYVQEWNSFFVNVLSLFLFTLRCSQTVFGRQAFFSHIHYFLNQRESCEPRIPYLKIFFFFFYFEKSSLSIETQFLDSSSWTHPVQSPVHSESSVMNRLHCNVIMNILHQVSLCELRGSLMVSHEKSSPLTLRVKMGHLNCCSGGRFLLILCRLFLQMGWLTDRKSVV